MSEPCCISDPQLCQKQLWRSQSISTSFESSLQGWGFSHSNGVILKHVVVKWSDVWVILFSDMWYLLLELFTGTVSTNQCWSNTSTITWLFQTLISETILFLGSAQNNLLNTTRNLYIKLQSHSLNLTLKLNQKSAEYFSKLWTIIITQTNKE